MQDPLVTESHVSRRACVCCSKPAHQWASAGSVLALVVGWGLFAWGAVWASRHEPTPFRYTFMEAIPGLLMLFALLSALWPRRTTEILADEFEKERVACANNFLNYVTILIATGAFIWIVFLAVFGWADAKPYYPTYPPATIVAPESDSLRGIFSISSGTAKTTRPPPTPSLPPIYPSGSAIPPLALILHGMSLCISVGLVSLAGMWREQDQSEKEQYGL